MSAIVRHGRVFLVVLTGNNSVSMNILVRSLFQEYICFIQEEHCIPPRGSGKVLLKLLNDTFLRSQLSYVDRVEWLLCVLGDSLGRECFAHAGWAMEHNYETLRPRVSLGFVSF